MKLPPALGEPDLWPPSGEEHEESEFPSMIYMDFFPYNTALIPPGLYNMPQVFCGDF